MERTGAPTRFICMHAAVSCVPRLRMVTLAPSSSSEHTTLCARTPFVSCTIGTRAHASAQNQGSSAHTQAQKHRTWRPMNCVPPMTRYSLPTRHRAALGPRVMLGIALAPPPAAALAWSRARGGLLRASPRGRAKESARAPLLVCPGHHDQAAAGHRV